VLQIGRALRRPGGSTLRRAIGALLVPFEEVHGWVDRGPRAVRGPRPWLAARAWTGARAVRLASDRSRLEGTLGVDFELFDRPGHGQPGARAGSTRPGAWSRFEADLALGGDGLVGARVATRTSFAGHQRERLDAAGRGAGRYLGVGTGFVFDTRRLAEETDQLAVAHLVGPELQLDAHLGRATVRWDLRAYADFALVHAAVFGAEPPFHPVMPPTSALRAHGYYYGYGTTIETRLRLEADPFEAALALRGHHLRSIDGLDRTEIGGDEDRHGVEDQRAYGQLRLGVRLARGGPDLVTTAELAFRRGTWADAERDTLEASLGLLLVASP
jgi:hypothetical protein